MNPVGLIYFALAVLAAILFGEIPGIGMLLGGGLILGGVFRYSALERTGQA